MRGLNKRLNEVNEQENECVNYKRSEFMNIVRE